MSNTGFEEGRFSDAEEEPEAELEVEVGEEQPAEAETGETPEPTAAD